MNLFFILFFLIVYLKNDLLKCQIIKNVRNPLLMKFEKVCSSIDIRKRLDFKQLENCTVIEGHLYIFMVRLPPNPRQNYPLLKEITESLLIYHVIGINSLGAYFPNLSLIRGQSLTYNYALVIKDTSLMNVGLTNLQVILNGGVRIDTNSKLCYISSVNWTHIVKQRGAPIKIINSRKICPDFCSKNCSTNTFSTKDGVGLCWSHKECQNVCSEICSKRGLFCMANKPLQCCHPECLAGCYGPGNDQCVSCKNVMFDGRCVQGCKEGYFKYRSRRCIKESECFSKVYQSIANDSVKIPFAIEGEACVKRCSQGKERDNLTGMCKDCGQECHPKNCGNIMIHSISDLKEVEGCHSVKELEINIREGADILSTSLEKYFSKLTVIEDAIKISQSSSITSLDFLKSLKVIKGASYQNGDNGEKITDDNNKPVVFEVYDNENLVHIWKNKSYESQSNIKILFGSVSFKLNRKLCPDKIMRFLQRNIVSQYKLPTIDLRIINVSNGDMAYCNEERLIIELIDVTNSSVTVICRSKTNNSIVQDPLQSALFMIKAAIRDLSPYELYNNCYNLGWQIIEGQLGKKQILGHLNPATRYAVYVESVRSKADNWLEISDFLYFTTNTTYPSTPLKFTAEGISNSEIKVSWIPPLYPNGILSKYFIWYQKLDINKEDFICAESCSDKSYRNVVKIRSSFSKDDNKDSNISSNSICNCNNCMKFCIEDQHQISRISDDFGLHMLTYHSTVSLQPRISDHLHNHTVTQTRDGDNSNMVEHLYHNQNFRNLSLMYSSMQEIHFRTVSADINSLIFNNLQHYSEYLFEIQACQESGNDVASKNNPGSHSNSGYLCGERSSISGFTLPMKGADDINMSFVDVSLNLNNVIIKWLEPLTPNGLILYFIIRYKEVSNDIKIWNERCFSRLEWLKKEDFATNESREYGDNSTLDKVTFNSDKYDSNLPQLGGIKLSNLKIGKYELQIKSVSIAGYSSWSKSVEFFIFSGSVTESYKEAFIIGLIFTFIFISLGIWIAYHYYRKKFLARKRWISSNPDYWIIYEIDEWEIKREDIDMIGWNFALGRGSFGIVYKGILKNLTTPAKNRFSDQSNLKKLFVAVKTLNMSSTVCERREFINEACYMKQFQSYHLVMLFGIVSKIDYTNTNKGCSASRKLFGRFPISQNITRRLSQAYQAVIQRINRLRSHDKTKANAVSNELDLLKITIQQHFQKMPLVVMELMENGDLAGYLRKQGEDGDGLVCEKQANLWALQIADGMLYLSDRKFVHRDLAARNCMVNADIVVKISDFGMARDVYYDCYYRKKGTGRLPVRWMAPEALRSAYFTVASDVWSYGVVIWEIVTLASMPFRGMSHHDVIQFVTNGGNLLTNSQQIACSKLLLNLMQNCWQSEPQNRPTFHEIIYSLKEFADTHFYNNSYYIEKEAQSTVSMEDISTDIISNYSKGNVMEPCDELI